MNIRVAQLAACPHKQVFSTFYPQTFCNQKFIQTCVIWRNLVALHENTALDKGGERMEVDLQVIIVQNPQFSKRAFVQKYQCTKPSTSIIIMVENFQNQKSSLLSQN